MYENADWISTASGSERVLARSPLATARGTDPYCNLRLQYIDLQSALNIHLFPVVPVVLFAQPQTGVHLTNGKNTE
jgi:hypothetical protein